MLRLEGDKGNFGLLKTTFQLANGQRRVAARALASHFWIRRSPHAAPWFAKAPKSLFAARNAFRKVCLWKGLILFDVLVLLGSPMISIRWMIYSRKFHVPFVIEENPLVSGFPV
ncbi:hypothetical protein [Bradyrhizobium sp. Ash2021]|uniref:hypothetical protein n=1 Tax=Bradyrhizobium sp. Ash2021 TaxID=2954771 RepID=UPI002815CEF5|nr:hypothetical protein [Bradyrhizobium sp. Ash2021]WMT79393.1 hypothetical protein NL528_45805 [Bradyrhizobium sp. Ash2021]